jgi:hypothetical protein
MKLTLVGSCEDVLEPTKEVGVTVACKQSCFVPDWFTRSTSKPLATASIAEQHLLLLHVAPVKKIFFLNLVGF